MSTPSGGAVAQPGRLEAGRQRVRARAAYATPTCKRLGEERLRVLFTALKVRSKMQSHEIAELLGVTPPTARSYMQILEAMGLVQQRRNSPSDPTSVWVVTEAPFWSGTDSL